jgi:cold shock CspA family protein
MHTGTILFYLADRGYGYLRLLDTREEFHFQRKNVLATNLKAGNMVTFKLREGRQGYFADEVRLATVA